ncbi:sulfiredoxin-1-like [Uloborus diversus]|uniref:sulfiredoxin-1-like n=1 Tax=Uloborus diversus TaxID=327109 RepID=UPI00240A5C2C|nr:sulfiredoxin-1-like [Uloborus diversus]
MTVFSLRFLVLRTGVVYFFRNALILNQIRYTLPVQSVVQPYASCFKSMENFTGTSIHAAHIHEIHEVPFHVLIRPFPSELDEEKVLSLMKTLKNPQTKDDVPPVDVLWVKGTEGGDYYYSFGGCHRYEAHKRLGLPTIRSKLIRSTVEDLRTYLGGSTPNLK